MATDELCFQSLSQLSARLAAGDLSPVALTQAYLERIARLDAHLNSYITVTAELALQQAREAEAQLRRYGPRSPLHGIPLALKDLIATRDIPTTGGARVLEHVLPDHDAAVVERLRAAGAVLLGKLNLNEFATLVPSARYGPVRNPWHPEHSPGGSSSGSGAAVAAGLCAAALGTDTGGSIRLPAALCGIVGLKPTYGRVSLFGVIPLAWSLDHVGPMARSVRDVALLLQVLAGPDARDLACSEAPVPSYTAGLHGDLAGLRLGVPKAFFADFTDAEVRRAFDAAVGVLQEAGAQVEEVALPDLSEAWAIAQVIINAEAYVWHAPSLQRQAADYGPQVRAFLERGRDILATDYVRAQQARARLRRDVLAACAHVDALLTPGALVPAPPLEARTVRLAGREVRLLPALVSATCPFNLTGQPALTLPCGFSATGLPLALQIVGKPFAEATVLRIGDAYEARSDWHRRRPPLPA
ncbi:MAG: amidase [Candidatus Tectimicrobiota bacterium]|nr:MAG: amidase [Candidatus Tectomicrobia bacterium]